MLLRDNPNVRSFRADQLAAPQLKNDLEDTSSNQAWRDPRNVL